MFLPEHSFEDMLCIKCRVVAMGKNKEGVIFSVAPNLSEMGDNYLQFIEEIKNEIRKQRISVVLNANSSMICLYWKTFRIRLPSH